jgi:ATP-dependent Clp protease ATP-binding subunit ClpC
LLAQAADLARGGAGQIRLRHLAWAVVQAAQAAPQAAPTKAQAAAAEVRPSAARPPSPGPLPRPTPTLDRCGTDLAEKARQAALYPVIGRDREIDTMVEILCRCFKRNPMLIGSAGVGKTAIVEGLAQRMVAGQVPEELKGERIILLSPTRILQGVHSVSELEERVRADRGSVAARHSTFCRRGAHDCRGGGPAWTNI